jgi:hypothetical protein
VIFLEEIDLRILFWGIIVICDVLLKKINKSILIDWEDYIQMAKHRIDFKTRTNAYKMTLQPELLKSKDLAILKKLVMPKLKKRGIKLKDVAESFKSLLHPLNIEKIKGNRPFYINMKGETLSRKKLKVLIRPD